MSAIVAPALPLGFGGCIYVLWRSTSLLMFRWFEVAGLHPVIQHARLFATLLRRHLPTWFIYSLPDAAWVACGVLLFAAIWSGSSHPARHFWVLLAPSLALGGEFAQLFRLLPGTFDIADVISCTLACAVSVLLANRLFRLWNPI
jgi:hypothetical protein